MKRFAAFALVVSIAMFSFGCADSAKKKADPKKPEKPTIDKKTTEAETGTPPAKTEKKDGEKK